MTRTLVVEESAFVRTVVDDALTDAGHEVDLATSGRDGLERLESVDPDVVTMSSALPDLETIQGIEQVMTTNPTPVLLLCEDARAVEDATADADGVFDGTSRDVLAVLEKPDRSDGRAVERFEGELLEAVATLASVDASSLALARTTVTVRATRSATASRATSAGTVSTDTSVSPADESERSVMRASVDAAVADTVDSPTVVVGASTGGPKVVERLLAALPIGLEATVLVVQHMPAAFTGRLADRLDANSAYAVREASDGDRVGPGEVAVAPGDADLEVVGDCDRGVRVRLEDESTRSVQPSIDVTMETAARQVTGPLCGVVLSGMGSDGAAGIEAIAAAGGYTIAQDEATSQIFGIPCQAIATGCVDAVVPGDEIAARLVEAVTDGGDTHV